jgi:hypothetical protein
MHCKVGFAIWEKAALIWSCFDAGTQSFSMVGTPVSLIPRNSASEIGIFHGRNRVIIQTNANGFRMRPSSHHVRRAQPHEFPARVRQLLP